MADLRDVERRIAELRAEIAPTLREIEALESAALVLRALDRGERLVPLGPRDFGELTMPEAAEQILLEHAPKALHYKQITDLAIARGFKGKRTNLSKPLDQIASSLRRMMGQRHDIFQQMGEGMYRIAEEYLAKKDQGSTQ